tara:strand:- start:42 stop:239 length:198 start_codon:yes stop_codon:yes gene_type:complete
LIKKGDLIEYYFYDRAAVDPIGIKVGVVVGRFIPSDLSLEEGIEVLSEGKIVTIRESECRCVNPK